MEGAFFRYFAAWVISGGIRKKGNSNPKSTRVEKEKRNSRMLSRCSARTEPSHQFLSKERAPEHSELQIYHVCLWYGEEAFISVSFNTLSPKGT
ncbi:hypothetical protein CEXT_591151 [Caerostris extrusa]|uniref:Uncharacterized protein n=1 Tax=Caerostris extrusa TaxID=172846 RepID=A0AAV4N1Y1_CAEEX|nr:hypothetical protein CEXT_591151 [Caerostris extrusa]